MRCLTVLLALLLLIAAPGAAWITDTASHPPPCCGTYGYERWTPAAPTFPAVGGTYRDPIFNETLTRLTNVYPSSTGGSAILYGINGLWNADGTAYLHDVPGGVNIISPLTGATIRSNVPHPATSTDEASFDPLDPDIFYYTSGTSLRKYSIASNTTSLVKTFASTLGGLGQSSDWIDRTGRYFLLNIGGNLRIWNKQTDTLYTGSIVLSAIQGTNPVGGIPPGWVGLSPDGNYVIASVAPEKFSFAVNHATATLSTTAVMFWDACAFSDHADIVSASDGLTYLIAPACMNPTRGIYRVSVTNNAVGAGSGQFTLPGNQALVLVPWTSTIMNETHYGCAATGPYQDWCYVEFEDGTDKLGAPGVWSTYKAEIVMMQLVPPFAMRRLFHHRARPLRGYCRQVRPNANWDGTRVIFASPFAAPDPNTDCGYSDLYRWDMPDTSLAAEDEFLGPFSTWTNVKTTYSVVGNGVTDDTTALQNAFTALGTGGVHTLYFPPGTYVFSTKLRLIDKLGVAIIGADPATTVLKWAGAAGEDMVYANAYRYSRLARITLDGNNTARALWDQDWDAPTQAGKFDTGNEYLDVIWRNGAHGLWCGSSGAGCAETTVRRNTFQGIPGNCIQLWNPNALDMWVWDSTFTACGRGVTNQSGAGAFRAYRSLFQNSTIADLEMGNTQVFSARDNVSVRSDRFWKGTGTGNPGPVILQSNTVIDSVQNDTIQVANQGPLLLFDNVIRAKSGGTAPLVTHAQAGNSATVSLGNDYSVASAVSTTGLQLLDGDTVVDRATIDPTVPRMPRPAVSMGRTVFEVTAGSSVATIQAAIASAVAAGNKAVVHLQAGTTTIATTLTIPAHADIQITGDGFQNASTLSWGGAVNTPMLRITGPTKVRIHDLEFHAQDSADGIVLENIDQAGARVHLGQVQLRQGYQSHLLVSGVTRAQVEWMNSDSARMTAGTAIQVVGGSIPVILWSGASDTNVMQYTVSAGGTLVARDMYYETSGGGASATFATFTDQGTAVLESLRIALPAVSTPAGVALANWQGLVTFLGSDLQNTVAVSGAGAATQFLGLGLVGGSVTPYLVDTTSPAASVVLAYSRRHTPTGGSEATTTVGTVVPSTIQAQTAFTRSLHPARMIETPYGVSDVRLQRVWVRNARHAVTVLGTP